jgi:hypothetical protein
MKHLTIAALVALSLFIMGCSSQFSTYDSGIREMSRIQSKYGADFEKSPIKDAIPSLISDLEALQRKIIENEDTKPLALAVEYRIKALESDRLLMEGFKWGDASTTEKGFGCRKGSERILNSSALRMMAAEKGEESVLPLQQLIDGYPEKAAAANLSKRTILSLTTTYSVVKEQALDDKGSVEGFCKDAIIITQLEDGLYHVDAIDEMNEEIE